ncbi:MAG: gliding motility-associated C-terminal domain-containing protein [Saprospiraceae bacterium]|nr:gliding motility-associated C-terminal domain-containing protein [Saprospiraceae bacterium]MCB9317971.1 gliding motility-associated C-terminal domain-containing protein [Lewinellaceae bacterium]
MNWINKLNSINIRRHFCCLKALHFGLLFLVLFPRTSSAQFQINGAARRLDSICYELTQDVMFVAGSIWNVNQINLNESFEAIMDIFLGCTDANGADGIVFGFQPVSTSIGEAGEGLGFQFVRPSIGIEFDTWQNFNLDDPAYDHIAIIRNGDVDHGSNNTLAGPVQALASSPNIEDCQYHNVRVVWDAQVHRLDVYMDCDLRLSYQGDIVTNIFGGIPYVFWGFTSATGGSSNVQRICMRYTTFLNDIQDQVICPGEAIPLISGIMQDVYWEPTQGLNNPFSPNPIAQPAQSTTYTLYFPDACDTFALDQVQVEVLDRKIPFDLGPDTVICEQGLTINIPYPGATAVWNGRDTSVAYPITQTGTYRVALHRVDTVCTFTDTIEVGLPEPIQLTLAKDTTICASESWIIDLQDGRLNSFRWNTADSLNPVQTITSAGIYAVTVSDGCVSTTRSTQVQLMECGGVFIPNVFSPNGDAVNDLFEVVHDGSVESFIYFRIYDRWGNLIYDAPVSGSSSPQWNGTAAGQELPPGVYVYQVRYQLFGGLPQNKAGTVTLIR